MIIKEAEKIIESHRSEKYYNISCLQVGEVKILNVYENGFMFKRKTDYIETIGIYEEQYKTSDIYDIKAYDICEVVTKRIK